MYWMNISYKKIWKPETTEDFSSSESWNGKNNVCPPWNLPIKETLVLFNKKTEFG